jgi:hypothetical protein
VSRGKTGGTSVNRSLKLGHGWKAFFLPIAKPTKLYVLVPGLQQCLGSARRAPAASSVKDDFGIIRQLAGSLFDKGHWDMDCAGNGAAIFDLAGFAHVHNDKIFLRVQLFLQLGYRYPFSSHDEGPPLQ